MVFPFGIGIGDFMDGIKVLKDSIRALSQTRGAAKQYQDLLRSLSSIEKTLRLIGALELDESLQGSKRDAILESTGMLRDCINNFLRDTVKFKLLQKPTGVRPTIGATSSTSTSSSSVSASIHWSLLTFKASVRKIEWAVCKREEVKKFREDINSCCNNILMQLTCLQL